jgi:hypothetical protein
MIPVRVGQPEELLGVPRLVELEEDLVVDPDPDHGLSLCAEHRALLLAALVVVAVEDPKGNVFELEEPSRSADAGTP